MPPRVLAHPAGAMAVFILETHYPSGRTWANICSLSEEGFRGKHVLTRI